MGFRFWVAFCVLYMCLVKYLKLMYKSYFNDVFLGYLCINSAATNVFNTLRQTVSLFRPRNVSRRASLYDLAC